MNRIYTDIACEIYEKSKGKIPSGVKIKQEKLANLNIVQVDILKNGLNREKGRYITIEMENGAFLNPCGEECIKAVSKQIRAFLPSEDGKVLVVGIGNRAVAPDALGPLTAEKIFVTNGKNNLGLPLRQVMCTVPGVSGATGIKTARAIHAMAMLCAPSCIILVDSICTNNIARLGALVQISNTGLSKKDGEVLNKTTLGAPVLAIGVPSAIAINAKMQNKQYLMTCKDINEINKNASTMLAMCINKALQHALTIDELNFIIS